MASRSGIYKITGPNGRIWIGSSSDIDSELAFIKHTLSAGTFDQVFHEVEIGPEACNLHRRDRCSVLGCRDSRV